MMKLNSLIVAGLEISLNKCLQLDPTTLDKLDELSGKIIAIELKGTGVVIYLLPGKGGFTVLGEYDGEVDATLTGTPLGLAKLGIASQSSDELFSGDVEIHGDMHLGQRFGEILKGLDIDWEELLSKLMGDVFAHKLGNVVRSGMQWGSTTADTLGKDLAEYMHEESRMLPQQAEINDFLSAIDEFRSDVDRVEARIKRLIQKLEEV
jgi:ubiquinone biosynthesis protein UbiJ